MFRNPLNAHVECKINIREAREARNRRSVAVVGRCGEGNMAFPGKKTRSRIEPDPAGARKIRFSPSMKISEIVVSASGAVERYKIWF